MKRTWNELDGIGEKNLDNLRLVEIRGTEYRGIDISERVKPAVLRDGDTDICVLEMDYHNQEVIHVFVSETVYFCPYCVPFGNNPPSIVVGGKPRQVVSPAEPCGICEVFLENLVRDPDETQEEAIERICRDPLSPFIL